MKARSVLVRLGAALLVVVALSSVASAQCSMCRTLLTNSEEGKRLSGALGSGILLMLAAPYLIFGSFVLIYFRRRWAQAVRHVLVRLHARRSVGRVVASS